MKDAQDADAGTDQTTHYMRLPWPLVAAGLIALLALVLGIGVFANRYLRPQVGLVPTPETVVAAPAATSTPQLPTSVPTAVPTLIVQAPAAATATLRPAPAVATSTPLVVASATPSALPTVEPALADEVGRAYVMFWRVRSQALLELDPSHLADVMDGDYLHTFEAHLAELRVEGRAIKSQVTLNYKVVQATEQEAIVVDRIEDDSFYVVPGTDQPLTEPANDVLRLQVKFRGTEGVWKVVESVSAD